MARTLVLGLHHVTATVDAAQADLDFYAELLGLRLVKKTVNFDNHHVYHFYYGDEHGTPGTIWTTFPYAGRGVPVGTKGAGQITVTSFSVPRHALDSWRDRLRHLVLPGGPAAVVTGETRTVAGEESIACVDPSGLVIAVVANDQDTRPPWIGRSAVSAADRDGFSRTSGVTAGPNSIAHPDARYAIRGLHSVTMTIAAPPATIDFMRSLLGFEVTHEAAGRTRLSVNGGGPGRWIDIVDAPDALPATNGLGTVHHVAMAVATDDDQLAIRGELLERGVKVTPVLDRQYFRSIYFREPGGVLFEVATVGPGFGVDEDTASLGQSLKLPPWEEPNRASIEAGLAPVVHR
jgi:glyoxalase family protein